MPRLPKNPVLILLMLHIAWMPPGYLAAASEDPDQATKDFEKVWRKLVRAKGLQIPDKREAFHLELAALRNKELQFSSKPLADLKKVPIPRWKGYFSYVMRSGKNDAGMSYVWVSPGYDAKKPVPLIVQLHGGGSGGQSSAQFTANNNLGMYPHHLAKKFKAVVIAPVVKEHVTNSWGLLINQLHVIDAIEACCQRFNIDRRRIHLTGFSMGGGGTTCLAKLIPDGFADFTPRIGYYWNIVPCPPLNGKAFRVYLGKKDAKFRVDSCHAFIKIAKQNGGAVELRSFNSGHTIPFPQLVPDLVSFWSVNKNPVEPDFTILRRVLQFHDQQASKKNQGKKRPRR